MKKLAAILSFLVCLAATVDFGCADGFGGAGFIQLTVPTRTASPPSPFPTMVAGLDIPAGQTPTQASMSTGVPRCLDATWGSGCNASTTKCIQPTSGAPLESCQPPQQLVITGGSTSGGVGTINYTNPANIAYPVGEVLIVNGALQSNWNTPIIHITSAPTFSGANVTLSFAALPTAIPVGAHIYVGGMSGSAVPGQTFSFGYTGPNPNIPPGGAKFQTVTASTTTSVTYSMGATNQVIGAVTITNVGSSGNGVSVSNVSLQTLTGVGTGLTASVFCQSGVGLQFRNLVVNPGTGTGYVVGDTVKFPDGTFGGTACNGNVLTVQAPVISPNFGSYYGTIIAPWTASASTCSSGVCSVSFPTANSCTSGCIDSTAQIVAGQTDNLVMSWHYGEQIPNSLQNGTILACVDAKQISGVNFVEFALDGGAFVKVSSPLPDPRGPGQSGLSVANTPIYCAQFQASSVPDGLHEVVAIGVPNVGYPAILNSNFTADATAGSAVLLSHNYGQQHFTKLGISNSTDSSFPNFNWNDSSNGFFGTTAIINQTITGGVSPSATLGAGFFDINYSAFYPVALHVGSIVSIATTVTSGQSCSVTGGTSNGVTLTYNLSGTCSFPVGSSFNASGIVVTGGNALTWNGAAVPISATSGPCNVASGNVCTISTPALSTANWSSGGTVTANWNGQCTVAQAVAGRVTCPTNGAAASWASGGTLSAQGNLMCNAGGNGDIPAPFNSFDVPTTGLMDPAHFQLVAVTNSSCQVAQNSTGCQVTSASGNCGNVATKNETLWLTIFSSGLDQGVAAGWGPFNIRGSYWIYTNAGGTIQKQDAYVDSWGGTATSGCLGSVGAAGAAQVAFGGTSCSNLTHAKYALAATNMTGTQVVSQPGGAGTCLLFTLAGNTSGAVPFYAGEAVDFRGVDTNTSPQIRNLGLYFIASAASDALTLSATPGGSCINDAAANIVGVIIIANDLGFDSLLLQCNASLGCTTYDPVAKTGNPETYLESVDVPVTLKNFYSNSSFFNISADTATPGKIATADSVSVNQGSGLSWLVGGGRLRVAVDSSDRTLSLNAVVPIGPIPYFQTPVSGSLAACPSPNGAHQCETLNFPAVLDQALRTPNGAKFQAPTSTGSPGGSIVVLGSLDSSSGHSWDCGAQGAAGVAATPCKGNIVGGVTAPGIISSTTTSVTFVNDAATGSLVYSYGLGGVSLGSGGTPGLYHNVAFTPVVGGSVGPGGSGGLADITIGSGHSVTVATETTPGSNYVNGDIVTGSIGGLTFQLVITGAKITPVNVIMELAAGSYGGPCANATTGVAIATPGAVFCAAMSDAFTAQGTNSNSYPAQMGGASYTVKSSNCFQVQNSTGSQGTVNLNMRAVATGGANDILSLTSGASNGAGVTTIPINVQNLCDGAGLGPFVFGNDMVLFKTMTDFWWDSQTNSGSDAENNVLGTDDTPLIGGAYFITNSKRFDRASAFDASTYAWGGLDQYNCCGCIDKTSVEIDISCMNSGQTVLPFSHGGTMHTAMSVNQGTPWFPIIGSLDASGANITCTDPVSGLPVNCLTPLSKTIEFAGGSLPYNIVSNWISYVICNMTSIPLTPATTDLGQPQFGAFNNNNSPATITFLPGQNPISSTCLVSQNPAAILYNSQHIDWDFMISGILSSAPATPINGNTRAPWTYLSSYVQDNVSCSPCGSMLGIAMQDGGNFDIAFNQMNGGLTQLPVPTQFTFNSYGVPQQSTVVINVVLTNSFMGTSSGGNLSNDDTQDMFTINSSGGINPSFPGGNLDPKNDGFWDMTVNTMNGGSTADNQTTWPTGTRSVDPVTGIPNGVPAPPFSGSMGACPWFCTLTDTGLGSF